MKQTKQISILEVPLTSEEEILQHWNNLVKTVKDIPTHKSVHSKVCISNDYRSEELSVLIQKALQEYSVDEIKDSIRNYTMIISSEDYYYKYKFKSLGFFLYSEKGLVQFLTRNNPFDKLRCTSFNPFTEIRHNLDFVVYDSTNKKNPLNTEQNTYLGVPTQIFKTIDPERMYRSDFLPLFQSGQFYYGHLVWLEESIASLLFKKENLELLKKLISIHRKVCLKFQKKT